MNRVGESARLVIADDHPLFRDALKQILSASWPDSVLQYSAKRAEFLKLSERGCGSWIASVAKIRPGALAITMTREDRKTASYIEWVTKTVVSLRSKHSLTR